MKQFFFCLCLLLCIYLLKAGRPVGAPTFKSPSAVIDKNESRVQKSKSGKPAYAQAPACSYTTLYVDSSNGMTSGDGGSWMNAYRELRDALVAAAQCPNINTILVAKGTYRPTNNTNRDSTFAILRGGLKLYGGYASGGGARNILDNPTILSGDIGNQNDTSDNSYHVVVIAGLGSSADSVVVDGFTIASGNANGGSGQKTYNGAGLQRNAGGGLAVRASNGAGGKIAIRGCTFLYNNSAENGGGLFVFPASPMVKNCTFSYNSSRFGGGMYTFQSSPTLADCMFSFNTAKESGGGMFNNQNSSPGITACTFRANTAITGGGMYNLTSSSPVINKCIFNANRATYGGGMDNATSSSPAITNCIFSADTASQGGGLYNVSSSSPTITNCTFSTNRANSFGGGMVNEASSPVINNCIIWANSNNGINNISSSTPKVSYSDVQGTGVYPGTGNINADPRYVNLGDPDGADNIFGTPDDGLKLNPNSPAINKGNNDSIPAGTTTDITGVARIQQGAVDMGAYESPYPTPLLLSIDDVEKAEGNGVTTTFTFVVRLSAPALAGGVSFTIATADSTATAPGDYTARSVAASIGQGDSTYSFDVNVRGDVIIEPTKYFKVKVTGVSGTNAFASDSVGIGAITNDDPCPSSATLYVDSGRSVSGDGSSWATAFKEFREALGTAAQCSNVSTIYVARGTYNPTDNTDRDSAFTILRGGLKLYGGYASGGGTRNILDNPTILSGDIGNQNDTSDNSYHVVVIAGLGSSADSVVVDGFTIASGNANGGSGQKTYNGAGLQRNAGGGLAVRASNGAGGKIAIRGCTFLYNNSAENGGGLFVFPASPMVKNCVFSYNSSKFGGGVYTFQSSPALADCMFSFNTAKESGGGMFNNQNSSPGITACTFRANTAITGGGMYNLTSSSPVINKCIFNANRATYGGGMDNATSSSPAITNCIFSADTASQGGGLYNVSSSSPTITNCTFSANRANSFGGGMVNEASSPVINNCIIWGNSNNSIYNDASTPTVSYSDVEGTDVYPGTGNININPRFVNPADPDGADNIFATADDGLQLQQGSPAINKGRNDSIPAGITTDITGAARIQQGTVDMGAYEFPAAADPCAADSVPPLITPKNITIYLNASGQATIQPFDVIQSVTDNCQLDSASIRISQSAFSCSDVGDSSSLLTSHLAYVASTSTGNQAYGGELGMEFSVNKRITIGQLGAFDHQSNGINGAVNGGIRVAVFNKATQQIVPGLDAIVSGLADGFASNHRLRNIAPVQLLPGNYVIVAKGYNAGELNGNSGLGSPVVLGDNASGAISYTGSGLYGTEGSGFSYPQNPDAGPANRYLAGTFSFSVDSTTPPATPHQTYTASTSTGVQAYGGELGMAFQVNTSSGITISRLGAFDHQGDGINGSVNGGIRVAIFNQATQTIVPGLDTIIKGQGNAYSANHRFVNITPVSLPAGNYLVVAKGYNAGELNGNAGFGTPPAGTDNAGGAIAYTGGGFYGNEGPGFSYPQNTDGGPATRYLAGSFIYSINNTNSIAAAAAPLAGSRLEGSRVAALVSNLSAAAAAGSSHQAYTASTAAGVQNYGGELGMEFRVNNPAGIVISQLGAFDHQGNGIQGSIRVAIFNKASKTIVSGLDATVSGQADAYASNHRLKNITPVTLLPGDYVVVAKGYNASELNGNAGFGTPPAGTDDAGGAISYTGGGLYGNEGAGFSYPLNSDGGPATRYLAGTFVYSVAESAGSKTVMITASDKKGNTTMATAQVTVKDTLGACRGTAAAAMQQASATVDVEPGSVIRLYPNPSRDRFTVQLSGMRGTKGTIEVMDINGRVLEQRVVSFGAKASSQSQVFSLSAQPSGVYFVRVRSDEGMRTLKVIVAR